MSIEKITKVIERLMLASGVKTQTQLASILEISQAAVTQAVSKGKIPEVWFYKVAYHTGRRVEWLRTGDGPEFVSVEAEEAEEKYRLSQPPALQILLARWKALSDTQRSILEHATALLESEDKETRRTVRQVIERLYEHDEYLRQQHGSAPSKKVVDSA